MPDLISPQLIVKKGLCIGCGNCASQSNGTLSMKFNKQGFLYPANSNDEEFKAVERFDKICPFSPVSSDENEISEMLFPESMTNSAGAGRMLSAFAGYAAEENFRSEGSSGGMVSWVASELLRQGMIDGVLHVVAAKDPKLEGHFFKYRISHTTDEIRQGAHSRYYPVELSKVLQQIRDEPGRYAVVGIPCFIKAIQLLRREYPIYKERIRFTLGLFCGHMKSAHFIESFAWQMKIPFDKVNEVEYRYKDGSKAANQYVAQLTLTNGDFYRRDWWHLADGDWGAGYFMNSACNFCDDVVAETADISFGDAWVEPYSSDGRGTNVIIVRGKILDTIIREAIDKKRLHLEEVDSAFIEQTQAAGLRQRREGLAYRLRWKNKEIQKRIKPDDSTLSKERKRIYRMRYKITQGSHLFFQLAKKINFPPIYLQWARLMGAIYHGTAYHKGNKKEIWKRFRGWWS